MDIATVKQSQGKLSFLLILAIGLALTFLALNNIPWYPQQEYRLEMAKKSGKNEKHANLKAREKAAEEYEKTKAEYMEKLRQPNKSAEDKQNLGKLRKKLERLRKKKDFTGENHSQNKKGN